MTELLHLAYYYGSYNLDLNILILKMVEFKLATRWSEFVTRELALVNYGLKLIIRRLLLLSCTFKSKFAFFSFQLLIFVFQLCFSASNLQLVSRVFIWHVRKKTFSKLTVTSFRKERNKELPKSFIEQINPRIL